MQLKETGISEHGGRAESVSDTKSMPTVRVAVTNITRRTTPTSLCTLLPVTRSVDRMCYSCVDSTETATRGEIHNHEFMDD